MLTVKQIIIRSIRLTIILNVITVIFSVILSTFFPRGLSISEINGYFGDITGVEAFIALLFGSANQFTWTEKWASAITSYFRRPSGGVKDEEESPTAERSFLAFVLCGVFLFIEVVALALFTYPISLT
ncbi:MAG: hypothetical protein ABSA11_10190 [Candidatus Bathyarchaeia archaeon]